MVALHLALEMELIQVIMYEDRKYKQRTVFFYTKCLLFFSGPLFVEPTSYDYDAPISEAGDLTEKFHAFKKVISKYEFIPDIPIPNTVPPKKSYGKVDMKYISSLFVGN